MPDRRCKVLMFHGTEDSLLGVDDPSVTPMEGNLYPIKFVESSQLQANTLGVPNPFIAHHIFDEAEHSFDNHDIEHPNNWNTNAEDADEKAKRLARDETLKWFAHYLKPTQKIIEHDPNDATLKRVRWHGEWGISYTLKACEDLQSWANAAGPVTGNDGDITHAFDPANATKKFFRLSSLPTPAPIADPDNTGFFRPYSDFDY